MVLKGTVSVGRQLRDFALGSDKYATFLLGRIRSLFGKEGIYGEVIVNGVYRSNHVV